MNTKIYLTNPAAFQASAPDAKIMWALSLLVKLNFSETHSASINIADLEAAFKSIDYDFESEYDMSLLDAVETYADKFTTIELEDGSFAVSSPQIEEKYSILIQGEESLNEEEVNVFHEFLKKTIRDRRDEKTGYAPMTDIGQLIREQSIPLPKNIKKAGEFLKLFPNVYESRLQNGVPGPTEVCLVEDKACFPATRPATSSVASTKKETGYKPINRTAASKSTDQEVPIVKNPSTSKYVSVYKLQDNLFIPNCDEKLKELCTISNDPALLKMPESEPSPYEMVMNLLEIRWCQAVQSYSFKSNNVSPSIILSPMELWFDTGLSSAVSTNNTIWIHAIYNNQGYRPQWLFDCFEDKSIIVES